MPKKSRRQADRRYKTKRAIIMIHKDFFESFLNQEIIKVVSFANSTGDDIDETNKFAQFFGVIVKNGILGEDTDPLPAYSFKLEGKYPNGKNKISYQKLKRKDIKLEGREEAADENDMDSGV